jgi:epoxyqueuosine reductase
MPEPFAAAPLAERVRARGIALGFERIGFARAGRSADADRFAAWLDAGRHADLEYMSRDRERRSDVRAVLPGCRTVIVGTVAHWWPDGESAAEMPARIARYARGRDYHRTLRRLLRGLCDGRQRRAAHRRRRHAPFSKPFASACSSSTPSHVSLVSEL